VSTFWALAFMVLVCWATVIYATRKTLAGRPTVTDLLWLVLPWLTCVGGIYLLWRLVRFARRLPKG